MEAIPQKNIKGREKSLEIFKSNDSKVTLSILEFVLSIRS
jgi:hypothetical protein